MFADMRKARVKVLDGSDLPVSTGAPPIHDELVALVRVGMTPSEALQASSRNAAEFMGRLAGEGTVEVGKKAKLVLLEEDPLTDSANTRRVAAVVLGGRLISGIRTAESPLMRAGCPVSYRAPRKSHSLRQSINN